MTDDIQQPLTRIESQILKIHHETGIKSAMSKSKSHKDWEFQKSDAACLIPIIGQQNNE